MDANRLFMKMKDTSDKNYRTRQRLYTAGRAVIRFAVFPLVLCAVLAGGAFTALDGVTVAADKDSVFLPVLNNGTSLNKSVPSPAQQACEEETADNNEKSNDELLQSLYDFDKSAVPAGCVGIVPISLYRQADKGYVFVSDAGNKKQIDASPYLESKLAVTYEESEDYQVLIIHTHGTEAYSADKAFYTAAGAYPRSSVKEENVVSLGDIFEKAFEDAGIKTLHYETPIDKESYSKAYPNAAKIIQEYIKKYPTIKYMFDIHRDAVELSDGSKAKVVAAVNGEAAAQLMFVVGSDRYVAENKNWKNNLTLAVKLQSALDEKYPGLMRPINIKQGAFNQFYTPLSILIEVGCDGNSMEEAKRSAKILAEQMVKTIKDE